jgi:hypothetical protein
MNKHLVIAFYLVRHMVLGDGQSVIVRSEEGPFDTREACETILATYANQAGLECRVGL